jgi:hypothetical protein
MNRTSPWTTQPRHLVRPRPTAIPLQGPHWKAMLVRLCLTFATCLIASSPLSAQGNDDKPRARRMPVQPAPVMPSADSAGWQSLFNGQDLKGWVQRNGWAQYRIEGDSILGSTAKGSPNSFLCTEKDYHDFELRFEVKVDNALNSGVQFRSRSIASRDNGRVHGPQVEIEASPGEAGFIYGEGTDRGWLSPDQQAKSVFKNDQWNQYVVRAQGARYTTWINGELIEDISDAASPASGFIGLQVHGIGADQAPCEVRWRNIFVRELEQGYLVNQVPAGFVELFNGKDFEGWHGRPHLDPREFAAKSDEQKKAWDEDLAKHWKVADSLLVNDGEGVYATTNKEYGDFELYLQYRTNARGDSGVYLRGNPQVQIWDPTFEGNKKIGADKGSGGLWNNKPDMPGKDPLVLADNPFGAWNQLRVQLIGERCTVWLNGQLVVDHARMLNYFDNNLPLFPKGPIQLQTHGQEIAWKSIFLREIGADEANQLLLERTSGNFQSIFNGKDFSHWQGATDNYQVVDGAIQCMAGKGGSIYHDKKYGDFSVRLQFQLPPGGNNGLAIRYPGQGDPAYTGMCELQVLDSEADMYKSLDKRQYHGSAYGMAAAHRGFLRPTGQWNYQVVHVEGSKIQVELNGTRILDTDLSQVKEVMKDSPHPGKDLKEGFFGFAGHGDPVRFRHIDILSK